MREIDLLTPVLEGGIKNVNFFNGRVLTGEAMQAEQKANHQYHRKLGQSIGEGVVEGLEVRLKTTVTPRTVVIVEPGQALNREGQMLCLSQQVEVSIVPDEEQVEQGVGLFVPCGPVGTATPTGLGAYILVMTPASGFEGQAPRVGLANGGVARTCESRYAVEGVQFRLLHLDLDNTLVVPPDLAGLTGDIQPLMANPSLSVAQQSRLRNLLAHLCLGTVEASRLSASLYDTLSQGAAEVSYGPLDRLRALDPSNQNHLSDCDVPLALIYWSQTHIDFVDLWSVRRRVHTLAQAAHPPFPALDRRGAEAEATLLQFQQQLAELTHPGTPQILLGLMKMTDHFRFLPTVGAIPERVGVKRGFNHLTFFNGLTFREPVFIEGATLRQLFRMGLTYQAIDLDERELIWLYRVRQNRVTGAGASQAYLVFASGFIPYQGDAQFDLARWNFSNYAPGVAGSVITREGAEPPGSLITGNGSSIPGSIILGG